MFLADFFALLAWASFLTIFLFYLSYLIILLLFAKKSLSKKKGLTLSYPSVSLVVPVYNEERIIAKKFQNIEEIVYPNDKIEVIFVDGHSTDKTPEIVMDHARNARKSVRLIRQKERNGYTGAVVEGITNSSGEIIIATDAASYHHPDAVQCLVGHFIDPEIGAVTGKEIVIGKDKDLGPQLERTYRLFYDFMRTAETNMDSTPDTKGEILAVRREVCNNLLPILSHSPNASFDSCVPYQGKRMGYRTVYDEQARYYEYAPASFSDRLRQQIRRATVLIGAMFLFKDMILRKKFGKFGLLIFPVHFVLECVLPSVFMVGILGLIVSTVLNPLKVVLLWAVVAIATIAGPRSRLFSFAFVQSQFALFIAIFRLAGRRKSLYIESIASTRIET
jgi:cellulose synthase/poly-beta-1,6-N-acetylglucosamine synthase-like glycosyltransferase